MADVSAASAPGSVAAFIHELLVMRRAGNTAGAITLVDRLFAGPPQAIALLGAVNAELFRSVALDPALSPALFRHLVERFGWRDPNCAAARADPQRHAALVARIAAEDWFASLAKAASQPGSVAAAVLARPIGAAAVPVLDEAGKQQARAVIAKLMGWDGILLDRLDARSLAALREAVEGPPLAALMPPAAKPFPISRIGAFRQAIGWSGQATLAAFALAVALAAWNGRHMFAAPPSPQAQARAILDMTLDRWVEFRAADRQVTVYFSQLLSWQVGLRAIRYGFDTEVPDRPFALLPAEPNKSPVFGMGAVVSASAPASLRFVSVQVTYHDGSTSPVRIFRFREDN